MEGLRTKEVVIMDYRVEKIKETDEFKQAKEFIDTKIEIQIRTIAMDFWASLEHKMRYKKSNTISDQINIELKECAETSANLDVRMQKIFNEINNIR